jgi:NAD(P) transhydrogenase subunit alpha
VKIGAPRETTAGEARVAMTPASATELKKLGHDCLIEAGAGEAAGFADALYAAAGVTVVPDAATLWAEADIVAKVRQPSEAEVALMHQGQTVIAFFWPGQNKDLLEAANARGATVTSAASSPAR